MEISAAMWEGLSIVVVKLYLITLFVMMHTQLLHSVCPFVSG